MPKLLQFKEDARRSLIQGVHVLALAVRGTLGPKGHLVVLDRPIGKPVISNDGITIASEIELPDRFENLGALIVREAAFQTNEVAGDGTTTSTILADALIQQAQRALDAGLNAVDLVHGLEQWGGQALDFIRAERLALPDAGALNAVASLAAGDSSIGSLAAEALSTLGPQATIVLESHLGKDRMEYQGGMQFDRGYISHHMATDPRSMLCVLENTALLLTDQKISQAGPLLQLARDAQQHGCSLLIIAEDFDPAVTAQLVSASQDSTPSVAAIRAPEFGPWRKAALEDLAIYTGGRFLAKDLALDPAQARWDDLGLAEQAIIGQDHTTITGGRGPSDGLVGRIDSIEEQLRQTEQPFERDKLSERLARLSGNTAVIFIGGVTTVEQKERMQRAEDAVNAAKSALRDGVVTGAGTAYVHAARALRTQHASTAADEAACEILARALEEPVRTLAENSGRDPEKILSHIASSGTHGFNAMSGSVEELSALSLYDSVTSVAEALSNALSVAKLVINTDVLIVDLLDNPDATAGPARGGGGERYGMS